MSLKLIKREKILCVKNVGCLRDDGIFGSIACELLNY